MGELFVNLLNRSIAAGWLIAAILLLRAVFKNAPKQMNCILWGIVAVRLICPVTFESIFSLVPYAEPINAEIVSGSENAAAGKGVTAAEGFAAPALRETLERAEETGIDLPHIGIEIAGIVWLVGAVCLVFYAAIRYLRLRREVAEAVLLRENVWMADRVNSPFILGAFSPKIYVPSGIEESQMVYILAHERAHIRRKDYIWKLLAYGLFAVYWFHPLSFAAYILFCKDMELACDEKVVREFDGTEKKNYADTLLCCSMQRRKVLACPIAFGETAVKERIKAILRYKKPAFWVSCVSVMVCIAAAACFLTNPVTHHEKAVEITAAEAEYGVEEKKPRGYPASEAVGDCMEAAEMPHGYLASKVAESEHFTEYQKWGISYDEKRGYLMYKDRTIGYFIDEFSEDYYTRYLDETGEIGIDVVRDGDWNIIGLEDFSMSEVSVSEGAVVSENPSLNLVGETTYGEALQENTGYSVPNPEYLKHGIKWDSDSGWIYGGKKVAVLYDNGSVYTYDKGELYLEILRDKKGKIDSVLEVTKEEMQKIMHI